MTDELKNALPIGATLHHYRIEAVLGHGGFGIVYQGWHQELGVAVAIKEYLPSDIAVRVGNEVHPLSPQSCDVYEEGLRRFVEEAKRLVQFDHTNIVRCRDFFRDHGTAYLIMDYEDGMPLSTLLRQRETNNDPLDEDDIKRIILPLLDGLAVVHNHDVLHRDIKPNNIFIRRSDEQPVLIDFGAAKQGYSEHTKSRWAHTEGYAPMEQIEQDGDLGPWTDIYALGATMWRIIATANPPKVQDRSFANTRGRPDPLTPAVDIGEGWFSPAFLQVVDKCLALEEQDRYQSVAELRQALLATEQHNQEIAEQARDEFYEKAFAAYQSGDFVETAKWFRKAARQGHAGAQHNLGWMYANGKGVPQDDAKSVEWYRKAAEQGYAAAQHQLGWNYANGKGVPQDDAKSVEWYRKAVEQGHAGAQNSLGVMYQGGYGVQQDDAEAVEWYRKAAKQGHTEAQHNLGWMYASGEGVQQDDAEATVWYRKAAEQGHAGAQSSLGVMYAYGRGVKQDDAKAAEWLHKAAEQGNTVAQYNLGQMYRYGMGVQQDDAEAVAWYRKAARQGHKGAQKELVELGKSW